MSIVAEPEEGKIYHGVITKIMDFGAFVKFVGSTEGLVHISEVKNERIASVSDFYKEGDYEEMEPCATCNDPRNIKEYMRNANLNK